MNANFEAIHKHYKIAEKQLNLSSMDCLNFSTIEIKTIIPKATLKFVTWTHFWHI